MLIWVGVENVGFFALLISWVVWLAVQVPKYRRSVDLPSMESELAATVHQAFEPAHVTVWLAGRPS